ncbi:MAG: hypothetical protein AAGF49_13205, partial [Pseudomonadota bacterium]
MTLPDTINLPAVIIGAAIIVMLLLWLATGRRSSAARDQAQVIAAVQAERDVLRANHAVEIATLEAKVAEAQNRLQGEMAAKLRLKEAEQALSLARKEADERTRELDNLSTERDRQKSEIEALQAKVKAGGTDDAQAEALARLTRERDEARQAVASRDEAAAALQRDVKALTERLGAAEAAKAPVEALTADLEEARKDAAHYRGEVKARESTIEELRASLSAPPPTPEASSGPALDEARAALKDAEERERAANEALSRLAYDRDGLTERVETAEKGEREAKAEADKREALLELRLQKIEELEA